MSLPPGFLDELRNRLSLAQVVGRKVVWDPRKSNQGKGDLWAPCPFHQEKTASFHVDDRQGFYYCFGCHAKGDAISFVQETENASFMEAVEILAGEAGMPMPARDPQAAKRASEADELIEINEAALRFFRLTLNQQAGAEARAYLDRRKMSSETRDRFEIGYAPNGNALLAALKGQGFEAAKIHKAGLAGKPDDGRDLYDFYRDRIMFPIRDARGRLISFGGRAMAADARAKYLNGPETPLFDKGRALYNHGPARAACGKGQPLIVAEGYMDVIALVAGGFEAAVAPLGTAVTADQLALMWRMAPEPLIGLDGDKAGLRAAYRVIDLALPLLEAGKSLRFAIMPEGADPDDILRDKGKAAMQEVLDTALPMVELLWRRETEGQVFDSPERRAMLDRALAQATGAITDPSLKYHYDQALKDKRFALFRSPRQPAAPRDGGASPRGPWRGRGPAPSVPVETTKSSRLVGQSVEQSLAVREAVVLATLIKNPDQILPFLDRLEALTPRVTEHATILHALLRLADHPADTFDEALAKDVTTEALDRLMSHPHVRIVPPVRHPDAEVAAACLDEELRKLRAAQGFEAELGAAIEDMLAADDEKVTYRLSQAAEAKQAALKAEAEDRTEFDVADNGVELKRSEREAWRRLLAELDPSKGD